jgi:diacylglycerol kinase family enzyme
MGPRKRAAKSGEKGPPRLTTKGDTSDVIVIVLNPASGLTRRPRLREDVEALCREAGIDARIRELDDPHQMAIAARDAVDAHAEAVVAGGGDGTVSAVASAVAGTPTPLGVLPLGTLNHFAKDAGIPLDLQKAVQTVAARHTIRVDVGRVNDHLFLNNASIGVYPSFVASRDRFREQGRSNWMALGLATAEVLRREGEVVIRLHSDRTKVVARTPFVFVGNNEYLVEGIKLGARTSLDSGRLHAYFAPPLRTRDLPALFARSLFGIARHQHTLQSLTGPELWVDTLSTATINVACDGELLTLATPLHYQSWPGALAVLAPAS